MRARIGLWNLIQGEVRPVEISLDLGTESLMAGADGRLLFREPCLLARSTSTGAILAAGSAAEQMLGRVEEDIRVIQPVVGGRLADPEAAALLIRHLLRQRLGWRRTIWPRLLITMSDTADRFAWQSLLQALRPARYMVVPRALAAARGAGLPVNESRGQGIVDFGAGLTEISILSLNQVIAARCLSVAGQTLDEAVRRHCLSEHDLDLSAQTAREVKHRLGFALPARAQGAVSVWGRDLISGLPRQVELSAAEVSEAIRVPLGRIAQGIQQALEQVPPGLAADLVDQGLVLIGDGALLKNLAEYLQQQLQLPFRIAERPAACAVIGALQANSSTPLVLAS